MLRPNDGRSTFWIDPRQFYKLHDQTVELYIEETEEDFSPVYGAPETNDTGMIANGDGTVQTKGIKDGIVNVDRVLELLRQLEKCVAVRGESETLGTGQFLIRNISQFHAERRNIGNNVTNIEIFYFTLNEHHILSRISHTPTHGGYPL